MREGPDIALIGSLIGDPARANMLVALMSGKALTATELAKEAGITSQTASSHLKKLENGGLVRQRKQGRHRYFSLAGADVADMLESLMGLAASRGHMRTRTGPKDPALRKARVCYNHLAGDMGVMMYQQFISSGILLEENDQVLLTSNGEDVLTSFGVQVAGLRSARRIFCKPCLDWSERRWHLAGSLAESILEQIIHRGWAKRVEGTRIIEFSRSGEKQFKTFLNEK